MSAKEMFEELGYEFEDDSNTPVYPSLDYRIYDDYCSIEKEISFYLNQKVIGTDGNITVRELQAINKQIEELGWK